MLSLSFHPLELVRFLLNSVLVLLLKLSADPRHHSQLAYAPFLDECQGSCVNIQI